MIKKEKLLILARTALHFLENYPEYRNNKEAILMAVKNKHYEFDYIDDDLKKDKEFIIELLKSNALVYSKLDKKMRKKRKFAKEAIVNSIGKFLPYDSFPDKIKKDRGCMLDLVKVNGMNINYLDDIFRNDRVFALEAVKQNGQSFAYIAEQFKNDREIILEGIKNNSVVMNFLKDKELLEDSEIVLEAVKNNYPIEWVSKKNDITFLNQCKTLGYQKDMASILIEEINLQKIPARKKIKSANNL